MGLDCDTCDNSNLHNFHTLDNGCEVCSVCYSKLLQKESQLKIVRENISEIELSLKACRLPRDIDALKALTEDAVYYCKRLREIENSFRFTDDQLKSGRERVMHKQKYSE